MQAHMSKRDLTSTPSGPAEYQSISESSANRHQHGHQYDHLHDLHRGRGLNNSDHAVLTNGAAPNMASGPFAASGRNALATGDEHSTAIVASTIGAASLSETLIEQSATSGTNSPPLAAGHELPHKGATDEITVPQSLLEIQSAASQMTPAYTDTSSTSKSTADADADSILQQQYSTAARVSLFGETSSILRVVVFSLWVFFFATIYH